MVMVDKAMKVAGKNPDGLVKGIAVSQEGSVITSEGIEVTYFEQGTLAASGDLRKTIPTNKLTRVFLFNSTSAVPYELTVLNTNINTARIENDGTIETKSRVLYDVLMPPKLISDGNRELVSGNGIRSAAYTDYLPTIGSSAKIELKNNSASESLSYMLVAVAYPYELLSGASGTSPDTPTPTALVEQPLVIDAFKTITVSDVAEYPLLDVTDYVRIESLEFASTSKKTVSIIITPRNKDGTYQASFGVLKAVTGRRGGLSVYEILANKHTLFDVIDETDTVVKFALNRYLTFPHGVKIAVKNNTDAGITCGIQGYAVKKVTA